MKQQYSTKPSWDLAPDWATHLVQNIHNNRFVFTDFVQGYPTTLGSGTFNLQKSMWNTVETRAEGTNPKPSWSEAPPWATTLVRNKNDKRYAFANVLVNHLEKWSTPVWEVVESRPTLTVDKAEDSGASVEYYKLEILKPTTDSNQTHNNPTGKYWAECNDVIEALNMTYAEANMFKEIWRTAAARTLGKLKANHTATRGAEKILFFAKRHATNHGVEK